MRSLRFALTVCIFCISFATSGAFAAVDIDAAIVKLRTSCQEAGTTLNNCFTDLPALNAWIWDTRTPTPSATSPLLIEIGPGTFSGSFSCENKGYVTLRGSGIGKTIIQNGSGPIVSLRLTASA
jgi:hypothetical protein